MSHPIQSRHAHPPASWARLRRSALVNALAVLALLGLLATGLAHEMGLSDWPVVKSLGFYGLTLVWLTPQLPAHLPHARLCPANQVTLLRLGLTALLAGWIGEPIAAHPWMPSLLTLLILVLDGLDGWLARRGGWASIFGARFDMETDALLVLVLAVLVWDQGRAGPWILLAGLARYLFVAAARLRPWLDRPLPPLRRRQILCVLLILTLLLALAPPVQPPASAWLAALGLGFVTYSFGTDVVWLWRRRADPTPAGRSLPGTRP